MKYDELVDMLGHAGSAEPESEAFILLSHYFKASKAEIVAFRERDYNTDTLNEAIKRRSFGEPIQYITGVADFFGLEFRVSPDCLIPRFDTEVLCEELIKRLPEGARFIEFCTGSGCIPIAVIKSRPDVSCETVELFPKTAAVAAENREHHCIPPDKLKITVGDALNFSVDGLEGAYDAIVSNPPYIPTRDVDTLSREVKREPRAALDGGEDGMIFYNKFVSDYACALNPDGFFAFEIGFDQAEAIRALGESEGFEVETIRDLGGRDRVAILKKNH